MCYNIKLSLRLLLIKSLLDFNFFVIFIKEMIFQKMISGSGFNINPFFIFKKPFKLYGIYAFS